MTDEEKKQFTHMQTDINQIKVHMADQGSKIDKMYLALMGSEIAKDGGLVGRIEHLETDLEEMREEELRAIREDIQLMKNEAAKSRWHLNLVWVACGFIASYLMTYILSLIFKH